MPKIIKDRLTIRFTAHAKLKLDEWVKAYDTNYSKLINTIVLDFMLTHEDRLDRMIDDKKNVD